MRWYTDIRCLGDSVIGGCECWIMLTTLVRRYMSCCLLIFSQHLCTKARRTHRGIAANQEPSKAQNRPFRVCHVCSQFSDDSRTEEKYSSTIIFMQTHVFCCYSLSEHYPEGLPFNIVYVSNQPVLSFIMPIILSFSLTAIESILPNTLSLIKVAYISNMGGY